MAYEIQAQELGLSESEKDILLTVLGEKIETLTNMKKRTKAKIDTTKTNDISRLYFIGTYNGLELALSTMTGNEPNFFEEVKNEK